nr:RagB/SusD family nutrient uptake outer membrane protein [uncultured Flavobacterium sp.]
MKKIIVFIGILVTTLNSCSNYIEEDNLSYGSAEEYYITAAGFESLVNVNYASLKEIYGGDPWLFESGTDMYSDGRNIEPSLGLSRYAALTAGSVGVDQLYRSCFAAIQQANKGIYYSTITEQVSTVPTRVGELKFLRANAYFLLVQTYGGVPIVLDNINTAITSFDRNSAEEVYSQIVKDLNEALPVVSAGAYNGRVNKRAVQNLLAKVYLTKGYETFGSPADFTTAATLADAVIGGQALNVSFDNIVRPGNEMNAETIFSVQFSVASNTPGVTALGNSQNYWFGAYLGPANTGLYPNRSYTLCPTNYALSLYEKGDKRWEGTFMTEIYSSYYQYYTVADKTSLKISDFYEPQWFTLTDRTNWNTANASRKATIFRYHNWGSYSSAVTATADFQLICVRKFDDPVSPYSGASSANYNTTPITPASNRSSTRDFVISRLGETYLVAAEAHFKAGNSATALLRLNEVRRRAGGGVVGVIPVLNTINIDVILDERGRELLGEYHRWFDLKRTGTLVTRTVLHNPKITNASVFNGNNNALKILRPIPQSTLDLNRNKNFPQNPAYAN